MTVKTRPLVPYILALIVVIWSMRNAHHMHFKHVDSTHHALNGAFVYDLVRTGNFTHPVAYAKEFYSRFPGITIPYHPPLFPFLEAIFYSVFGVSFFTARLSIAVAAGICTFLMFRLVQSTHRSDWLAFVATLTFMALPASVLSASDVLLEFPALAFTLGALFCVRDLNQGYPWSRAYPFALISAAAVWTKQHAVFLGLVPFILILLERNWRVLRGLNLWASTAVFGVAVAALTRLSAPVNHAGVTKQFATGQTIWPSIVNNVTYYGVDLRKQVGIAFGTWLVLSAGAFLMCPSLRRRRENQLYLAWILALVPILLPAANRDFRYLLFGMPAVIVLGYEGLGLVLKRVFPSAQYVPALITLLAVCLSSYMVWIILRFPFRGTPHIEVADVLKERAARRILYCGEDPTSLAFAMRIENPGSRAVMLRADKLDPAMFTPEAFEQFASRYGVDTVVLEPGKKPHPWDCLFGHPTKSMVYSRAVSGGWNNKIKVLVFDFTNPSRTPESAIDLPISNTSGSLKLQF